MAVCSRCVRELDCEYTYETCPGTILLQEQWPGYSREEVEPRSGGVRLIVRMNVAKPKKPHEPQPLIQAQESSKEEMVEIITRELGAPSTNEIIL